MSRRIAETVCLVGALALPSGCAFDFREDRAQAPTPDTAEAEVEAEATFAASTRADLKTKRWRQLSLDLQGALELPAEAICKETGNFDCAVLHTAQLGGVSIDHGLYEPIDYWTVTSGLSMERFALQACHNRLVLDREADAAAVYSELDLAMAEASAAELDAQSISLWRRILARDPAAWELQAARQLHTDAVGSGGDNGDWAALLCFSLATSTEHLLY